jgi:hypothetical protein
MMGQSKEFEDLKISVALRLDAVERPRIDRVGGVEASLRDIHRQVKQLQHNWMTNWGAHEQSMALLRDDVMGHVEQMRRANGDGAAGSSHSAAAGAVTYIRLDEEDRKAIRKTLDQHGRDLARLDTKKADAGLVGCLLAEKAGVDALERKLDRSDFEEQLRALLRRLDDLAAHGQQQQHWGGSGSGALLAEPSSILEGAADDTPLVSTPVHASSHHPLHHPLAGGGGALGELPRLSFASDRSAASPSPAAEDGGAPQRGGPLGRLRPPPGGVQACGVRVAGHGVGGGEPDGGNPGKPQRTASQIPRRNLVALPCCFFI